MLRRALQRAVSGAAQQQRGFAAGPVGCVSGVPEETFDRKVVIYSPAQSPSQRGKALNGTWKISFGDGALR